MGHIFIRFDQLYVHPSPMSTVRLALFYRFPPTPISFPFRRWAPWLREVPALFCLLLAFEIREHRAAGIYVGNSR